MQEKEGCGALADIARNDGSHGMEGDS